MPQGLNLGPLLFNIDIIDLFYECTSYVLTNIASCADDTKPYPCRTKSVIAELYVAELFIWFEYNHLKDNPGKSHLLLSTKRTINISISDISLTTSNTETLLGIIIDSEISFDQYLSSICSKSIEILHALGHISGYMSFENFNKSFH